MVDSSLASAQVSMKALNGVLESYQCTRQIGHGAMGIVYEAEQRGLGRRVALKLLPPNLALRDRTVKRFLREAEAMGRLGHPNIVDVYEVGSVREFHYFTMRYVEGPPLDRVLKAGPLAVRDVIAIGIDVSLALAHAHARGVLHRDVKPGNLLRDGEKVVLTDFGLARPMDSDDGGTVTESGDLVGTPLYMAPEQISGDYGRIDGRADVWGLGVTLYELLAERAPFSGTNASSILHSILHRDAPLIRKLRTDVPGDLEAVIHKCLEKDPARRYTTAAALLEDLVALRDGRGVTARAPKFTDPLVRWVRRHPLEAGVVASSLFITLVLGAFGWVYFQSSQHENLQFAQERDAATRDKEEAVRQRDAIRIVNTSQDARQMLMDLRNEWSLGRTSGDELQCREAELRVFDLLDTEALGSMPLIRAEALALAAEWARTRGRTTEQVLDALGPYLGARDDDAALVNRAAVLTGLRELEPALTLHRQRSLMNPRDPRPWIDAGRIERLLGIGALDRRDLLEAETHLRRAIAQLGNAIDLARGGVEADVASDALIDRAQCWIDLVQPEFALHDLERVLAHDTTNVAAQALQLTARRQLVDRPSWGALLDERERVAPGTVEANAPKPDGVATGGSDQGFRPLFRAFRKLLQTTETPQTAKDEKQ